MKLWLKFALVIAACFLMLPPLAFVVLKERLHREQVRHDHLQVRLNQQIDDILIKKLRADLPIGSTLAAVHARLRSHGIDAPDDGSTILLLRGREPSFESYCGPYTRYIRLTVAKDGHEEAKLRAIEREMRGENCL